MLKTSIKTIEVFFEASSSIKTSSSITFFIFLPKDNNVSTSEGLLVPRGFQVEDDKFSYSLDRTRNLMLSPLVPMSTFKALAPSLGSLFFILQKITSPDTISFPSHRILIFLPDNSTTKFFTRLPCIFLIKIPIIWNAWRKSYYKRISRKNRNWK